MLKAILAVTLLTNFSPLDENQLTQYSTIDALLSGVYDGNMSVAELKTRGNFGLGTFNGIDGEMIIVENKKNGTKRDNKRSNSGCEL